MTDIHRFSELVRTGQRQLAADPASAEVDLGRALELWRAAPLADADGAAYSIPIVARLEEQRLGALADRAEASIGLGKATETISDLEELAAAFPLRERFVSLLMVALDRDGRTSEALTAYDRYRIRLADELGTDPTVTTQELHLLLLRGSSLQASPIDSTRATNLRAVLTSFLGRDTELRRVDHLLQTGRLVTIVGPGGAGKTRLSGEVGQHWRGRVADGVWLVELASVTDSESVDQATLAALGLRDSSLLERAKERNLRDARTRLLDTLADADCVLIVDNCEHLIEAVADLVDTILTRCPRVRVVATSREPLGVTGEALCALPPLGLPPEGVTAAEALTYPSVQLLAQRAEAVRAGFAVDDSTVTAVVTIARRLDGLPLALELAAARLRVLPVEEIAARLADRFRLLTGGTRTALPRHRTLRAVVEWSWDLLTKDERLLAERLSVFPAGATAETTSAVCGDEQLDALSVPDLLVALADKSLLQVVDEAGVRFRMLETIREYGVERLSERGEVETARRAHAAYFVDLAARLDPVLRTRDQLVALATLRAEWDNLLAAVRYLGDSGAVDETLRLTVDLTWFWTLTGAYDEAALMLVYALRVSEGSDHPLRPYLEALSLVSELRQGAADPRSWEDLVAEMAAVLRRIDAVAVPNNQTAMVNLAQIAWFAGNNERAERFAADAVQKDDPWIRGAVRAFRAAMAENLGDVESMQQEIDEAYREFEQVGDRWGLASALNNRGMLRTYDGDLDGAIADYAEAGRLIREIGSAEDDLLIGLRLAGLHMRSGDTAAAHARLDAALTPVGGAPVPIEAVLIVGAAQVGLMLQEGRAEEARADADRLRVVLDNQPTSAFIDGHLTAIVLAVTAGEPRCAWVT